MVQVFYSKVTDLLRPHYMTERELVIRMDKNYGVVSVDGVTKLYFDLEDMNELEKAYEQGVNNRIMRETLINETSSRSHLIFAILIEITRKGETEPFSMGKLTFIDLAGSESLAYIGVCPNRFFEGMQINEGLKCLGRVIKQVSCNVKVSYDLHPLTKLMQDSLGGYSKTIMIANIAPSKYDIA